MKFPNLRSDHNLVEGRNDWDHVPDSDLTLSQRIVKRTGGAATLASLSTSAGLGLYAWGLHDIAQGQYGLGVTKAVVARIFDLTDGYLANKFSVKSRFGKDYDGLVDAAQQVATVGVLSYENIIPDIIIEPLALAKMFDVGVLATSKLSPEVELSTSTVGKLSGNAITAGLLGYTALSIPEAQDLPETIENTATFCANALLGGGLLARVKASYGYLGNVVYPAKE